MADRAVTLTGLLAGVLLCGAAAAAPAEAPGAADRQAYLDHCAACHLESGQGVPSAFPPFDARIGRWAATEAGRDYLVSVVSNGLFGLIQVNGTQYAGAMPQMRHIESSQIAAALSYVVTVFGGAAEGAFTAEELDSRRERIGSTQSRTLRPGD